MADRNASQPKHFLIAVICLTVRVAGDDGKRTEKTKRGNVSISMLCIYNFIREGAKQNVVLWLINMDNSHVLSLLLHNFRLKLR